MKVMVLYGGDSPERDVSLSSGRQVAGALESIGHEVRLLDPWTGESGPRLVVTRLVSELAAFDPRVVFIALHGGDGENGRVQAVLDLAGVEYTGSGVRASAIAMDKVLAKLVFGRNRVRTPEFATLTDAGAIDRERVHGLGFPLVVKPSCGGSTIGLSVLDGPDGLEDAVRLALRYDDVALCERFVPGRELTVAVLDGEALPIVEILPESGLYDYSAKYTSDATRYVTPAELGVRVAGQMTDLAVAAYGALGCSGVARVDFRLDPDDVPWCLELNTVPGMTETSLVPKAAAARGMDFSALVDRLATGAIAPS